MKAIVRFTLSALMGVLFIFSASAQKRTVKDVKEEYEPWHYEFKIEDTDASGRYLVRVWTYSRQADISTEQAQKNALHGILFKGSADRAPLINDYTDQKHGAFFKSFFTDGGPYMQFAEPAEDYSGMPARPVKAGKGYKLESLILVDIQNLKKQLTTNGIPVQ